MVIKEDRCARIAQQLLPDATAIQLAGCVQPADGSDCASTTSDDASNKSLSTYNDRGNWIGKLDFFLSCVGYAVGLGNIWRFPYLCYRSGGGAFLLPYVFFLVLCGMPMFMLELCFGQFASLGPITIWRICPIFRGVGYAMVVVTGIVCIYYNIIITWTLYYMYLSFQSVLPWSSCGNLWNSDNCVETFQENDNGSFISNSSLFNSSLLENSSAVTEVTEMWTNLSSIAVHNTNKSTTPSEEFWKYFVLQISTGIEELGGIRKELLICLAIAWIVIFLCLCKGVKSSGRVVYVSATFPYLVLLILLVRGVTLPGAINGIKYYLIPRWELLFTFRVWGDAATQIFYSVGMAWGSILTMASYNRFSHNALRDAMLVPVINCGTSVFAGFVVFSIIGFMAHETQQDIKDVVSHGPGLAFIVYPGAVTRLPFSPLWAFLFFAMVFTIGLDSQFGMFECVISSITDEVPILRRYKLSFTGIACFIMFLLGIPCVTKGGMYILTLMDWYSATFPLMFICLAETVAIGWFYGTDRFVEDIKLMVGRKPALYFKLCWKYFTPLAIIFLLIFNFIDHENAKYNDYLFPTWSIVLGWMMALTSILAIPLAAIYVVCQAQGSFSQRILQCLRPSPLWGPAKEEHRLLYKNSLSLVPSTFRQTHVASLSNSSELSLKVDDMSETGQMFKGEDNI